MKKISNYFYLLLVALIFINLPIVCAAPQEISAEGTYRLGDRDTRETAKKAALADAKRKIIEQAGVFVESYTEVNNFKMTKDQIKSTAGAIIKVKSEQVDFYENGTLCKAFMVATVDPDDIKKMIISTPTSKPTITTKSKVAYKKLELNGHYYKVFNENSNWQNAKNRCEKMGGYLVTITSFKEQQFIEDLLREYGNKNFYWIGAYRSSDGYEYKKGQIFKWVTGEGSIFSNFADKQPDNYQNNEDVLMIFGNDRDQLGKWNDISKDGTVNKNDDPNLGIKNFGFICEWESIKDIK